MIGSSNSMTMDSLRYDGKNNLVSITHQFINDYTGDKFLDSGTFYFYLSGSDTLPTAYKLVYKKYYQAAAVVEDHMLTYDDSSRIMLDSMTSTTSTEENIKGIHYSYFPDLTVLHIYQQGQFDFFDSIQSPSGNLAYFSESYPDENGWSNRYSYKREILTDYVNPFSGSGLSKSMGAFFIVQDQLDFLSKNLTTLQGFFYSWSTDSAGRVLNGVAPDGSFVKFSYK